MSATLNGQAFTAPSKAAKYKPSVAGGSWFAHNRRGQFTPGEIEDMLRDPQIKFGLRILLSPLHTVVWSITASDGSSCNSDPEQLKEAEPGSIAEYVHRTRQRFWSKELGKAKRLLAYGSLGGEINWQQDASGRMHFRNLRELHFKDSTVLELDGEFWGLQMGGVPLTPPDNWLSPPRVFWCVTDPEPGSFYGVGRLEGAWLPWKARAGHHGADDILLLWATKNEALPNFSPCSGDTNAHYDDSQHHHH